MGVFENLTDIEVTVQSGTAAILELPPIDSHPPPVVTWSNPDGSIGYEIEYATSEHKLVILNASAKDAKAYKARATNTQIGKEEYSPFFNLRVVGDPNIEVAPSIIIGPKDMQINKQKAETLLNCIANAQYEIFFFASRINLWDLEHFFSI